MRKELRAEAIDALWTLGFMVILMACVGGAMFVSSAYLRPLFVAARGGIGEFVFLFGGLAFGIFAAISIIGIGCRLFVDEATFVRWFGEFDTFAEGHPAKRLVRLLVGRLR